jgi:hypothetical protein
VREAPWFTPWDNPSPYRQDLVKPVPLILGLYQDRDGLIWVFIRVAEMAWQPSRNLDAAAMLRELTMLSNAELEKYTDTVVEVIDPVQARVVASRRFTELLLPGSEGIALRHFDAGDVPRVAVYELRLNAQRQR